MNDLFEQLKSEPAVNKYTREAPPPTPPKRLSQDKASNSNKTAKLDKDEKSSNVIDKYIKSPKVDKYEKVGKVDKSEITPKKADKHEKSSNVIDKYTKSPKVDKYEKVGKIDKPEITPKKTDKHEKSPRKTDRNESPSKSDKHERRPAKYDKYETPSKSDKFEKSSSSKMSDQYEKSPKNADKYESPARSDRHEKSAKKVNDHAEKSQKKSDKHESPAKSDKHDRSSKIDKNEKSSKFDKNEKLSKFDKNEKSSKTDRREESPQKADRHDKSPTKIIGKHDKTAAAAKKSPHNNKSFGLDFAASVRSTSCSSPRRDSMPPPRSAIVFKKPTNKSRSMSPPKLLVVGGTIKPFKVLIERKKLEEIMAQQRTKAAAKKTSLSKDTKPSMFMTPPKRRNSSSVDSTKSSDSKRGGGGGDQSPNRQPTSSATTTAVKKMTTPTKAQQKLFDPAVLKRAQKLKPLAVKRCMVRLQRSNLKALQKQLENLNKAKKLSSSSSVSPPKPGDKRKNTSSNSSLSPPSSPKKGRPSKELRAQSSFFIKLTTSPSSSRIKLLGKGEHHKKKTSPSSKDKEKAIKKPDHFKSTIKPTKFTRTQLIKNFGKRFFRSRVKIERCKHPLMRIFESNARARKLQAKGNKSKNLSVSFKEQVEIFGDSDSNSDSSDDDDSDPDFSIGGASTSKAARNKALAAASTPMPARLKKVENGKLIDDIELDLSLFIDPRDAKSSTPFIAAGRRRKLEKKSYSPLKGDGTPSPRKEQLKLANERLPPSGLRRLNIDDVDDEDDEDDDCEYIVPIDIPQRRGSRVNSTNSTNIPTDSTVPVALNVPIDIPQRRKSRLYSTTIAPDTTASVALNGTHDSTTPISPTNGGANANCSNTTSDSFASAEYQANSTEAGFDDKANCSDKLPTLKRISPAPSLHSLRDLVDSSVNSSGDEIKRPTENIGDTSVTAIQEIHEQFGVTLDTDMSSLQLFVEDDSQNNTAVSKIVESIIEGTMDDLSKDIEMSEAISASNV